MGYHRAGFEVVGVDLNPQPHYPFEFHQADALTMDLAFMRSFDAVHASPVCKRYSTMSVVRAGLAESHPDQIPIIRTQMIEAGKPYIIENVQGAPLLRGSICLCGQMFGLNVIRHRWFETSFMLFPPYHPRHVPGHLCIVGHGGPANQRRWKVAEARQAMGIDWMTRDEIVESIPPAYTEFIGRQLIDYLNAMQGERVTV
jgi:DNA (cytosine-5)-methyltransferase 1